MLHIATEMVDTFLSFCQQMYGTEVIVFDPPKKGHYARFMLGENIVIVRDHVEDAKDPLTVEVFCSNENKLEQLTNSWAASVGAAFEEEEKEKPDE